MDRGAWQAMVLGVAESDTTWQLGMHTPLVAEMPHTVVLFLRLSTAPLLNAHLSEADITNSNA